MITTNVGVAERWTDMGRLDVGPQMLTLNRSSRKWS